MLATIRNRRALIAEVEPFSTGPEGQIHLVRLEYIDSDGVPEDRLIWEREVHKALLEPTALPPIERSEPMLASEFDALQRAIRWTALSPYLSFDRSRCETNTSIASPFFGAVQIDDFQLVPLLKALQMPRISLLLADDVGLGKTVEAGLILSELLLRRRIRRVLILCPAALRKQWQQEMRTKFALPFDVIDRAETHALQKRLGLDANPWRTFPRIVTSYHYLRQPDVLEQFRSACRQPEGTAQLPWDLLIVDEVHNLMPSNFGEDSDLSKMLRAIAPWFEHKLFLSATPHNGHTRCFSGLLEQLDPVRFTQSGEFTPEMQQRLQEVVVRRLKREINALDRQDGKPPRFCERLTRPIPLYFSQTERRLSRTFEDFRSSVKSLIAASTRTDQLAGSFAVEVLNKRLLSCPYAFAHSWYRFREGNVQMDAAEIAAVQAAKRSTQEDLDDDQESEGRLQYAAQTTGSWFKPLVTRLKGEIDTVDAALTQLGLVRDESAENSITDPKLDERFERLLETIQQYLRTGEQWNGSDRIVVFTEYKTTLDYLVRRLRTAFKKEPEIVRELYGGMDDRQRDAIKSAFNDPDDPVRVLVATDAASEGLNLQETAHIVLHYDIPWNPARLDQRNGRLDRHGQAQDVLVLHFTSEEDADLKFLAHVVEKVNTIREELGSMGEVFDAAFQRRFIELEETDRVVQSLDAAVEYRRGRVTLPSSVEVAMGTAAAEALQELEIELDLTPEKLVQTLEIALGLGIGLPRLEGPDEQGKLRLCTPIPQRWEPTVDEHLRLESLNGHKGALPAIVFDPKHFIQIKNNRPVYRPAKDTVLMHLGHPMFHQALGLYARARFPGGSNEQSSRWTIRYGSIPAGVDALLLLTVEELAVNELREPFHHWVRTVQLPIVGGALGDALPHLAAGIDQSIVRPLDEADVERAVELWDEIAVDVHQVLDGMVQILTQQLQSQLAIQQKQALEEETTRFKHRLKEVEKAMRETSLQKLEKEREKLINEMQQLLLIPQAQREQEEKLRNLEDEMRRRRGHYQVLLDQLTIERERVIQQILPKRYCLRGAAQVFPVTVEIRFSEA